MPSVSTSSSWWQSWVCWLPVPVLSQGVQAACSGLISLCVATYEMLTRYLISRGKKNDWYILSWLLRFSPGLKQRLVDAWGVKSIQISYVPTFLTWLKQSWFSYIFLKNCFPSQFLRIFWGGGGIFRGFFSWLYIGGEWEEVHWFGLFPHVQLTSNDHCCPGAKCERIMWDWAIRRSLSLGAGRGRQQQSGGVGRNSPMSRGKISPRDNARKPAGIWGKPLWLIKWKKRWKVDA